MRSQEPCRSRSIRRSSLPWPDFVGLVPPTQGRRGPSPLDPSTLFSVFRVFSECTDEPVPTRETLTQNRANRFSGNCEPRQTKPFVLIHLELNMSSNPKCVFARN